MFPQLITPRAVPVASALLPGALEESPVQIDTDGNLTGLHGVSFRSGFALTNASDGASLRFPGGNTIRLSPANGVVGLEVTPERTRLTRLQVAEEASDPGCRTADDVGRLWFRNQQGLSLCSLAGAAYQWRTVALR